MTPARVAEFMASLFTPPKTPDCRLLDPGAGLGILSAAFLSRFVHGERCFEQVDITAYELDQRFHEELRNTLEAFRSLGGINSRIEPDDFIESAINLIQFDPNARFTHAILNPPYRKINSASRHRALLERVGIQTVNLYSAFVALSLELLAPGGQLVAIVPRSFCNGPYYRPFRNLILSRSAIRHIHLFSSRKETFKDDAVLQENVIILLERGRRQGRVRISTSTDSTLRDYSAHDHAFDQIVYPQDQERFIHIPIFHDALRSTYSEAFCTSLEDLGLQVSTGPVVDFRLREHLRFVATGGSVPLIYPGHFGNRFVEWPKRPFKKPNGIERNVATEKWLYPNGYYTLVRRFSAKEERRRIVANVLDPSAVGNTPFIGFENHLNVYHIGRAGLSKTLAMGLSVYLNSTVADTVFRRFNGHTQVNATDLRLMKYPDRKTLLSLGKWALSRSHLSQEAIDQRMDAIER